ncbi:Nn.00g085190.m01.CDS01 [Neocucurbitaria sp. VM-36]
MAQTMKAWQYNSTKGGIEKNLKINDAAPLPTITDNELLIRVHAVGINPVDHKVTEGPLPLRLVGSNLTPCSDFCGKVAKVGKKVDDLKVDEWVFGSKMGALNHGSLAQYVAVPRQMVASLPEGVKVEDAAGVGIVGMTAIQATKPNVKKGDKVFINGGSGGTGVYSIQVAKALGCHVTTTCSTPNVELCKSLGADEVIDYKKDNIVQALVSKGPTFSLVVDNVGNPPNLFTKSSSFLLPHSKFVQVGVTPSFGGITQVGRNILLPGFLGGGKHSYQMLMSKPAVNDMEQLRDWLKEGKVKGVVDSVWEWEDAPRAFEKLKTGRARGKIIIKVKQEN